LRGHERVEVEAFSGRLSPAAEIPSEAEGDPYSLKCNIGASSHPRRAC